MAKDQELIQAVKSNDITTVRKILAKIYSSKSKKGSKSKYNLNIQDEDGFTALHHASLTGNTEIIMALLDMECNVNARDRKGMSPLHLAGWAGKTEIAKLLIQARSCVNLCADSGETPLHLACQHCNVGVVEVLLAANADATVINKTGESALDLACRFGHMQVVDQLLSCKDCEKLLELYEENPRSSDPPLHISCKTGREEIVIMLLEAGADINQSGANGTALHEAALYGKTDVVKILLDHGADVSITNEEGYTPLDLVLQFTSSRASADIKNLLRDASKNRRVTAKALRDYCNMYDPTCLSFKAGDVIEILEQNETGRWKGKTTIGKKEMVGYFPASMVKLANPRKTSVRTSLMRDAAVLPVGKYEMVTLPSASPSPLASRPRMSSFGKPNGRCSVSPPSSREGTDDEYRPSPSQSPVKRRYGSDPIANGLQDSDLYRKSQQSVQYVEVSVDKPFFSPTSPVSPGAAVSRTQYAEVVLPPTANGVSVEVAEEEGEVPSLPKKQSQHSSSGDELESDIWVPRKESVSKPQLPLKMKREEDEVFVEEPKSAVSPTQPSAVVPPPSPTPPEPARTSPVPLRLVVKSSPAKIHSPELSRKGYEDMNLSSPEKEDPSGGPLHRKLPPRMLDFRVHPIPVPAGRRQGLAYENVEVKSHRGKGGAPPQSMLITEVDQQAVVSIDDEYVTVNRGVSPAVPSSAPVKHRYENVSQEFEGAKGTTDQNTALDYETMDQSESQNYESMGRTANDDYEPAPEGYEPMRTQSHYDVTAQDANGQAYENVALTPKANTSKANTSASESGTGYVPMNDPPPQADRDYINISVPTAAGPGIVRSKSPSGTPTGLSMHEYNALYDWLESCKLAIYVDNFVRAGFDMVSITGLTPEDLTAISVTKTGHRKKLLSESRKRRNPADIFPKNKPDDIMTWLQQIGLDQYILQFIDGGFDDMDFVQDITIEDLDTIGITRTGHQRKIWMAVNALQDNSETTNNSAPGGSTSSGGSVTSPSPQGRGQDVNVTVTPIVTTSSPARDTKGYMETDLDAIAVVTSSNTMTTDKVTSNVSIGTDLQESQDHETDLDTLLSHLEAEGVMSHGGTEGTEPQQHPAVGEEGVQVQRDTIRLAENGILDENLLEVSVPSLGSSQETINSEASGASVRSTEERAHAFIGEHDLDSIGLPTEDNQPPETTAESLPKQPEAVYHSEGAPTVSEPCRSHSDSVSSQSGVVLHEHTVQHKIIASSVPQSAVHSSATISKNVDGALPIAYEDATMTARIAIDHEGPEKAVTTVASEDKNEQSNFIETQNRTLQTNTELSKTAPLRREDNIGPVATSTPGRDHKSEGLEDKVRCVSLDSSPRAKRPPPPVKPKSIKRTPPKIAPKPAVSPPRSKASSFSGQTQQHVDRQTVVPKERLSPKPAVAPPSPTTTSEGRSKASSFSGQSELAVDTQTDSGADDDVTTPTLDQQIRTVFKRPSLEDLLANTDDLKPLTKAEEPENDPQETMTDEELQKELDCTDNLFKDINSMLSDFSTELDSMFDNDMSTT